NTSPASLGPLPNTSPASLGPLPNTSPASLGPLPNTSPASFGPPKCGSVDAVEGGPSPNVRLVTTLLQVFSTRCTASSIFANVETIEVSAGGRAGSLLDNLFF